MNEIDKITGQYIDCKEGNDNAPPSYSAPSSLFEQTLSFFANKECSRCGGTGYIGIFKRISGGRCFECIPDDHWNKLFGDFRATGTDRNGNPVCEIRYITECTKPGFFVAEMNALPSIVEFETFDTFEKACEYAINKYGV